MPRSSASPRQFARCGTHTHGGGSDGGGGDGGGDGGAGGDGGGPGGAGGGSGEGGEGGGGGGMGTCMWHVPSSTVAVESKLVAPGALQPRTLTKHAPSAREVAATWFGFGFGFGLWLWLGLG